jgi:hypothetical protein
MGHDIIDYQVYYNKAYNRPAGPGHPSAIYLHLVAFQFVF